MGYLNGDKFFIEPDRDSKPFFNFNDIANALNKINRVLSKPIVDLKNLPGIYVPTHQNLDQLMVELNNVWDKINNNRVNLIGGSINKLNASISATKQKIADMMLSLKQITTITKIPENNSSTSVTVNQQLRPQKKECLYTTNIILAKRGFYTKHIYSLCDITSAHKAAEESNFLCFFKNELSFRKAFREKLSLKTHQLSTQHALSMK